MARQQLAYVLAAAAAGPVPLPHKLAARIQAQPFTTPSRPRCSPQRERTWRDVVVGHVHQPRLLAVVVAAEEVVLWAG